MVVNRDAGGLSRGKSMKGTDGWKEHIANENGTIRLLDWGESLVLPLWPMDRRKCNSLQEYVWRGRYCRGISFFGSQDKTGEICVTQILYLCLLSLLQLRGTCRAV